MGCLYIASPSALLVARAVGQMQTVDASRPTVLRPTRHRPRPNPVADSGAASILLIGCVKGRAHTARPARELYISPLFGKRPLMPKRWVSRGSS
jgi:hypothetical protein